jgi:ABC-2 type transport system permease protein
LKSISALSVVKKDSAGLVKDLEKGRIAAIISLKKDPDPAKPLQIHLKTSEAVNPQNIQILRSIMEGMIKGMNEAYFPNTPSVAVISNEVVKIEGRPYRNY